MSFSFPTYPPPNPPVNPATQLRSFPIYMRPVYAPAYPLVTTITIDLDLSVRRHDDIAGTPDYTCSVNTSRTLTRAHPAYLSSVTASPEEFFLYWDSLQPPQRIANWSLVAQSVFNLSVSGSGIPGGATDVDVTLTLTGLAKDVAGTLTSVGYLGERLTSAAKNAYIISNFLPDVSGVLANTSRDWNQPGDAVYLTGASTPETFRNGGTVSFSSSANFAISGDLEEDWTINDLTITFDT